MREVGSFVREAMDGLFGPKVHRVVTQVFQGVMVIGLVWNTPARWLMNSLLQSFEGEAQTLYVPLFHHIFQLSHPRSVNP